MATPFSVFYYCQIRGHMMWASPRPGVTVKTRGTKPRALPLSQLQSSFVPSSPFLPSFLSAPWRDPGHISYRKHPFSTCQVTNVERERGRERTERGGKGKALFFHHRTRNAHAIAMFDLKGDCGSLVGSFLARFGLCTVPFSEIQLSGIICQRARSDEFLCLPENR